MSEEKYTAEVVRFYKEGTMSENNARWYFVRLHDHEISWAEAGKLLEEAVTASK
jgi:hypothetical protein